MVCVSSVCMMSVGATGVFVMSAGVTGVCVVSSVLPGVACDIGGDSWNYRMTSRFILGTRVLVKIQCLLQDFLRNIGVKDWSYTIYYIL